MKVIISTVIVWIVFLKFFSVATLGQDTPSPQALNANFAGGLGMVHFDPVSEVLSQMLGQSLNSSKHICMDLSAPEVQRLNMFVIHYGDVNAEQDGETCNSQTITVNEQNMYLSPGTNLSFTSLLHISYYEYPDAIQAKILDIMGDQQMRKLDPHDRSVQNTATDITMIDRHRVIREVRNNNPSHVPGKPAIFTALTCILTSRIPTGLVQVEYDENNNQRTNRINKIQLCRLPAQVITEIWQHHIVSDSVAPKFCLTMDDAWLTAHNLALSSATRGCQEQDVIWKNAPDIVDPNNQITVEIRRNFPFYIPPMPSARNGAIPGGMPNPFGGMGGFPGSGNMTGPGPGNIPGPASGNMAGSNNMGVPSMGNSPFAQNPTQPGGFPMVGGPPFNPSPMQGVPSFGQRMNPWQAGGPAENFSHPGTMGPPMGGNPFSPMMQPGQMGGMPGGFNTGQNGAGGFGNPFGPSGGLPSMAPPLMYPSGTPTKIADKLGFLYTDPGFGTVPVNKVKLIIILPTTREALVIKIASQNLTMAQVNALITQLGEYQIKHNLPHK